MGSAPLYGQRSRTGAGHLCADVTAQYPRTYSRPLQNCSYSESVCEMRVCACVHIRALVCVFTRECRHMHKRFPVRRLFQENNQHKQIFTARAQNHFHALKFQHHANKMTRKPVGSYLLAKHFSLRTKRHFLHAWRKVDFCQCGVETYSNVFSGMIGPYTSYAS